MQRRLFDGGFQAASCDGVYQFCKNRVRAICREFHEDGENTGVNRSTDGVPRVGKNPWDVRNHVQQDESLTVCSEGR